MDIEDIRQFALQKNDVTEGFPFGESTLVFKVYNKMFLIASLDEQPLKISLKCNPEKALELREEHPDYIMPGYHLNKLHWNTIITTGITNALLIQMINDSYDLVLLKKKKL